MRTVEILTTLKAILDGDTNLSSLYPTLTVTAELYDSADDEIMTDYPWISLRYVDEVSDDVIGTFVDKDDAGDVIQGLFKTGLVTAFCWSGTSMADATNLSDYAKQAFFKARDEYEDEGIKDISDFDGVQATPSRGPFDAYRAVLQIKVWVQENIT